ncbi:diguanylate cyclase (GGDEF) domain-containing protein [Lachnospiraceae bacterium YSD2013]|nr:diguanylate cyclase (GGDEF) domain-containing protein [Lachnospiraceae bacterium YSD2013]
MQKRLALFAGELFMDYQSRLYEGIKEAVAEYGVKIDIFTNYGVYATNYLHTRGEINVITIPNLERYDGVIIAPDTLTVDGMYEELHEKIQQECFCPIVCIRAEKEEYYNVLVDDSVSMEQIVEHFIVKHGLKKIFYMSGTQGMTDAKIRLDAYKNVMKRHGLPVRKSMIYHGNYWTTKAKQCLEWFAEDKDQPEAIVCANDYMALSLYRELSERGVAIPEDIKLSGYDNIVEGQLLDKRLASAEVPVEELARKAVKMLTDILSKKKVPRTVSVSALPIMEGTCGCHSEYKQKINERAYEGLNYLKDSVHTQLALSGALENCETVEDVLNEAFLYSKTFGHKEMYVCLCEDREDEDVANLGDYTEKMRLVAIFSKADGYVKCDERFDRVEILPDRYKDKISLLSIFPLHFRGHCMGYLALTFEDMSRLKEGFILWSSALSNYLDKIKMYEKNKELLRYREESNMDSLTGLMNRRGLDLYIQKALDKIDEHGLHVVSVDMDGLKYINDNFGHAEGDVAIKELSKYLKSVQNDRVGAARTGGDEFLIIVLGNEDDTKKICKYIRGKITKFNTVRNKEYELSASIGYEKFDPMEGIVACINKADEKMYVEKSGKKNARK